MLRLSGDGRMAVLAVQGEETLTWRAYDVSSGQPLAPPVTVPFARDVADPVVPLRFEGFGDASVNADGSLLAIGGGAEGRVLVFDTADGSTIGTALLPAARTAGRSRPTRRRSASTMTTRSTWASRAAK